MQRAIKPNCGNNHTDCAKKFLIFQEKEGHSNFSFADFSLISVAEGIVGALITAWPQTRKRRNRFDAVRILLRLHFYARPMGAASRKVLKK